MIEKLKNIYHDLNQAYRDSEAELLSAENQEAFNDEMETAMESIKNAIVIVAGKRADSNITSTGQV